MPGVSPWLYLLTSFFFFFNDTATTEIYTLSLHDALPILKFAEARLVAGAITPVPGGVGPMTITDRKSTRLNSSHGYISYAVFCLKKKKNMATYRQRLILKRILATPPHPAPFLDGMIDRST